MANGTPQAVRRLKCGLITVPSMGVVHDAAGYPEAIAAACRHGIIIPILK